MTHGKKFTIKLSDVESLRAIVGTVIMTLIGMKDQFKKIEDLMNWIEDEKFS
jgi:hypothetical protein